jgi:hypothetical protein
MLSEALGFIATFVIIGTVFGLGFTLCTSVQSCEEIFSVASFEDITG